MTSQTGNARTLLRLCAQSRRAHRLLRGVLLGAFLCLAFIRVDSVVAGKIIKCLDANGQTVFTYHERDCAPAESEQKAAAGPDEPLKVNFREPARRYRISRDHWEFRSEESLVRDAPQVNTLAINQLKRSLNSVFEVLPQNAATELADVRYVLLNGPASPLGGLDQPMSYISAAMVQQDSTLDPDWAHSIVVFNAGRMLLDDDDTLRRELTHELARAWHATHRVVNQTPVEDAWRLAKNRGLYKDMPTRSGDLLRKAPPLLSADDYFAGLSQLYFTGADYAPFDRTALADYDPAGYAMLEMLWLR
ncbi:hypothetical protein Q4485_01180 [Granulosicoccaceae sp. 1_MG-2023]|nr:hypothetical protein [Granulosicoccaceae sp. 1_MG-2023]